MGGSIEQLQAGRKANLKKPRQSIEEQLLTLSEAQRPQAERIARSALPSYVAGYFKCLRRELSLTKAVRIFCYHCTGWDRAESRDCSARGCPLWMYRPGAARPKRSAPPSPAGPEV